MNNALSLIICSFLGIALGFLAVLVFNSLPSKWLTDYNEEPDEKLSGIRAKVLPEGVILAFLLGISFAVLYFKYGFSVYTFVGFALLWVLLLTALSDIKYQIIPDQFIVFMTVLSAGFIANDFILQWGLFHKFYLSPFLGALIGGGTIFLIGFIGAKILKKDEAMGFGDVKLLAVAGLVCGFPGILIVLLLSVLVSGVFFIVLILFKRLKSDERKPLGPYIVFSVFVYILFYSEINWLIDSYCRLINFQ